MLSRLSISGLKAGLFGLMLAAAPVLAHAADIADHGGFFSATAVEKANTQIREIEKKTGRDIRIETFATVPSDKVDAVAKMDKKERDEFMHHWRNERVNAVHETGTFIMICKEPPRVETWFNNKLHDAGMTKSDRDQVTEAMIAGLKAKDNDSALNSTIHKLDEIYTRLSPAKAVAPVNRVNQAPVQHHPVQHHQVQRPHMAPARSGWSSVIFVLGIVLVGIFLISMVSRLFSSGAGYPGSGYGPAGYGPGPGPGPGPGYGGYGPGYGYGGGGGGFMRGLAGGIFGAMAGNWLYDSFGGRHAHAQDSTMMNTSNDPFAGSQTLGDQPNQNDDNWSDQGQGGGGWFGGDDSGGGGGDFGGGGDYGGGGDSGGGDF